MKLMSTALGLVLAIAAVPAAAQYNAPPAAPQQTVPPSETPSAQPQIKPSPGALKAIVELQTAVNAKDYTSVPAKVAAAKAVAKTKEDKYIIGQLHLKAALAANDNAGMAAAIDTIASSGYIDATKSAGLYSSLGSTLYNAKQFDQAATAFDKAIALNPRDSDALISLAETRNSQGRKAEAVATFQRSIQASVAAGQKPQEALYKRAVGIAYDAQLPIAADVARQWVAAYPSADSWRNSVAIYRNMMKPDVEGTLDLLRLLRATNALSGGADYSLFATAASDQSNFVEAQSVVDQGLAAKQFTATDPVFKDIIAGLKSKPKLTDADLVAATGMAKTGASIIRVGDRYYGLGQYAKAAELYRKALAMPGVDPNLANLHIGMALARAGDKPGASAALTAVTGQRADIAKFWLLYVQTHA